MDYVYYNKIWSGGKALEPYQEIVRQDVLRLLPEDITSILDVGCGNGFITNSLPEEIFTVGIDVSFVGLQSLMRPSVNGEIAHLPFSDNSFDLIMSLDTLEHILNENFDIALRELERVSAKYILLAVPFMENLENGKSRCRKCQKFYHINYHQRTFDLQTMQSLFDNYVLDSIIFSGTEWEREMSFVINAKLKNDCYLTRTLCTYCGFEDSEPELVEEQSEKVIRNERTKQAILLSYFPELAEYLLFRTEIICLYRNIALPQSEKPRLNPHLFSIDNMDFSASLVPLNEIDFTKVPLYYKDTIPFVSRYPYFLCNVKFEIGKEGALFTPENNRDTWDMKVGFFLPIIGSGHLIVEGYAEELVKIVLYSYNLEKGYCREDMSEGTGELCFKMNINYINTSQYGLLYNLEITGILMIKRVYIVSSDSGSRPILKKTAHYLYSKFDGLDLYFSTSLYRNFVPLPECFLHPDFLTTKYSFKGHSLVNALLYNDYKSLDYQKMLNTINIIVAQSQKSFKNLPDIQKETSEKALIAQDDLNKAVEKDIFFRQQLEELRNNINNLQNYSDMLYNDLLNRYIEILEISYKAKIDRDELDKTREEVIMLRQQLENLRSELFYKLERTFSGRLRRALISIGKGEYVDYCKFRNNLLASSEPAKVHKEWIGDKKSFLMITHDQKIDRRIIHQAGALIDDGWKGIIVALSFNSEDTLEIENGVLIHRIGLDRIVPNCSVFWCYQNRQRLIQWWNRGFGFLSIINWVLYKFQLLLKYKNINIYDPLPFDNAFYSAARRYKANIIISHDLPSLRSAARLAEEYKVPLVYDAHELYYEQRAFSAYQKQLMRKIENELIGRCNVVFTVNESIANEMSLRYKCPPPKVLLNVTDPPDSFNPQQPHKLLRSYFSIDKSRIILLFQGGFLPHRNLENLVKAMESVSDTNVVLILMGEGPILNTLKKIAEKVTNSKRIFFKEAVPQEELLKWTASADLGIIPYPHIDLNSFYCTPNKLFEFIQAGIPIIANDSPELRRFVHDTGFGRVGQMKTPKDIGRLIDSVVSDSAFLEESRRKILARRNEYSWSSVKQNYVDVINAIIAQ